MNYSKKLIIALSAIMALLSYSCNEKEDEMLNEESVIISEANEQEIDILRNWLNNNKGRIEDNFKFSGLYVLEDIETNYVLYSAIDTNNPNEALNYGLLPTGEMINVFKSKVELLPNDAVKNEIYNIDGDLAFSWIDYVNGERQMINTNNSNGRINGVEGWFSNFDSCIGDLHNPTGVNTVDILFVVVADAASAGLYSAFSGLICVGVASGECRRDGC